MRDIEDWDEMGNLSRARRWDLPAASLPSEPEPATPADAELRNLAENEGGRVVKIAVASSDLWSRPGRLRDGCWIWSAAAKRASRMKDRLLSLDWWTKLFSALAVVGLILILAGRVAKVQALVLAGACLGAPVLVLGGLLLCVGVPYILFEAPRIRRRK